MKPVLWLVEDEPSIADTLVYTLESEGFEVRWFTSRNFKLPGAALERQL